MLSVKKEKIEVINYGWEHRVNVFTKIVLVFYSFVVFGFLSYLLVYNLVHWQYNLVYVFFVMTLLQLSTITYLLSSVLIKVQGID